MSLKEDTGKLLPNTRDNSAVHSIKNKDIPTRYYFQMAGLQNAESQAES